MKNTSIETDVKVNPIFKTGDKDDVNNYRHISILPTLSEVIEKMDRYKSYFLYTLFFIKMKADFEYVIRQNQF